MTKFTRRIMFALGGLTALLIATSGEAVTFHWTEVGDPGNTVDTAGRGAVAYTYKISTYEVTNSQYVAFLNSVDPEGLNPHGVYHTDMGGPRGGIAFAAGALAGSKYSSITYTQSGVAIDMSDRPVNFIDWWNAARFVNWLHNGQGSGDTESGVYDLSLPIDQITRSSGATYALPSVDEWYKAAFYDPTLNDGAGGYWTYATGSNASPTAATFTTGTVTNADSNTVVYEQSASGSAIRHAVVGQAGSSSYYGTYDQSGNMWEWTDTPGESTEGARIFAGGSWASSATNISAAGVLDRAVGNKTRETGFRVALVPEPASLLLFGGLLGVAMRRRAR